VDQCSNYDLYGNKIKRSVANIPLSITPDIKENLFEDGSKMPCEIKWTTSSFTDPEQIRKIIGLNGFLLVFKKDRTDCPIPQIEIDRKDFESWFQKNSNKLATETTRKYSDSKISKEPTVYINYLSTRMSGRKNWEIAKKYKTWGVSRNDFEKLNKLVENVKKGDVILFFYAFHGTSVRVKPEKFKGHFSKIYALLVTKSYYRSNTPKIWDDKEYPHRLKFKELFTGGDIRCEKRTLGAPLHSVLHRLCNNPRFVTVDPSMLLKVISLCAK
jgi:hypothetical protein